MQLKGLISAAFVVALAACSGAGNVPATGGTAAIPLRPQIVGHGFKVSVFARGNAKHYKPDPIVSEGSSVYVAFQNGTNPDGTGGNSTIVQYNRDGIVVRSIQVPGRCDGMRWNPYTNRMWITVNEDANSALFTWNPKSGALKYYTFSSAKHGGGYDDLAFGGGKAFLAASNPTLSPVGINTGPAVVSVVLNGSTAEVTTVLKGNAKAKDAITGKTVRLNLTDPDSMTVAPNGDVLLVSQGDSEIIFLQGAGMSSQAVSRLIVGTQIDDTVYATQSSGLMYVADSTTNAIYSVTGRLQSGAIYTEAPGDAGVAGFVGTVDPLTGIIKPVITGFTSPTGLIFALKGKT